MKRFFFLLICSFFLFACGEQANDVVPVKEGGALAGGWWLIYVIFGVILPAGLIIQGWYRAKKGTHYYDETGKAHFDPTPQPWYKHISSQGGIGLAIAFLIILIFRLLTYN